MKEKGFTLIEVIAVILIIGILFMIAIPTVSEYIIGSRKNTYASNVKAYMESSKGMLGMRDFGDFPDTDEIILVPLKNITLEKNNSFETPFGSFIEDRSYIIIEPSGGSYKYYAYTVDTSKYALNGIEMGLVTKGSITQVKETDIMSITDVTTGGALFKLESNGLNYRLCAARQIAFLLCKA